MTILYPTLGGALIGLAAVLMMLLLGRISGVTGIFFGALQPASSLRTYLSKDRQWRWLFLLGLPVGVVLAQFLFNHETPVPYTGNLWLTAVAGLLVGLGTKMGGGCTSGHGVCGISRFSLRSIVATVIYILFGMITVLVVNKLGLV